MPVRASLQPSSHSLVLGSAANPAGFKISGGAVEALSVVNILAIGTRWTLAINPNFLSLTSDQVGIPAELKHINKRRKRNQQGLPQ